MAGGAGCSHDVDRIGVEQLRGGEVTDLVGADDARVVQQDIRYPVDGDGFVKGRQQVGFDRAVRSEADGRPGGRGLVEAVDDGGHGRGATGDHRNRVAVILKPAGDRQAESGAGADNDDAGHGVRFRSLPSAGERPACKL